MNGDEHTIRINGHKLRWGVRDIAQLVVLALSCVGLYFTMSNRINVNERSISDLQLKAGEALTKANAMDTNGTHRSHEIDTVQQQMIDLNSRQISDIEKTLRDLNPKVDKIDTNVLWLMSKQLERNK
jgi:hypothetical protein